MPEFTDDAEKISVDTDGPDGAFIIKVGKHKPLTIDQQQAKALSAQVGYAVEFVNLYARGPR